MSRITTTLVGRPLAALAIAVAVGWPGAAVAVNEVEPNDQRTAAQMISNLAGNFVIDGGRSFANTSDDFFSFMVRGPGLLRIESSSPDGAADSIMGLFNAAGSLLASDDDSGPGAMSTIDYMVGAAGIYTLGFSGYNPGLLACTGSVTQCYDTNGDFLFDTFVAGGGSGGSAGWDYRISLSGVALVPEPHAALMLVPGLAWLMLRRRQRSDKA